MVDRSEIADLLHRRGILLAKPDHVREPWTGPGLRRIKSPHGREALAVVPDATVNNGQYALLLMLMARAAILSKSCLGSAKQPKPASFYSYRTPLAGPGIW